MPSETIPVISVIYIGSGMRVEDGVKVGVGVGTNVATSVGGGRSEAVGAVSVGFRVGKLTIVVRVGARASPECRLFIGVASSKMAAAWAEAKERRVPARKVAAIRVNSRITSVLGRRGWFIVDQSIS
jgi:hypothetical protein